MRAYRESGGRRSRTPLISYFLLVMDTSKARRVLGATAFVLAVTLVETMLFPVSTFAQNAAPAAAVGRIAGTMFDSLSMLPLAGATIWINGTNHIATTDSRGRFQLDSLPVGNQTVAYSSPSLDSLGFGPQGKDVVITAGTVAQLALTIPSLQTFWRTLCRDRPRLGADSGIVWGIVQNAETSTRYEGASAQFSWYDLQKKGKGVEFAQLTTEVRSDNTGTYYACGLPTDILVATRALGRNAASGEVEFAIGKRGVFRVNLAVSSDMVVVALRPDSTAASGSSLGTIVRGRGTSILRGTVRDDRNRAMPDALVSVASADTAVRTGKDGTFVLSGMPAGTHSVQVRTLGYAMTSKLVDIAANTTTVVNFVLPNATVLATYNVRTERRPPQEYEDYLSRRQLGAGYALEFGNMVFADPIDILVSIPRLVVKRGSGDAEIFHWVIVDGKQTKCFPKFFLDGAPVDATFMQTYPVDNLRAVEVFDKFQVPMRYVGSFYNSCGAVMYWTANRWKQG